MFVIIPCPSHICPVISTQHSCVYLALKALIKSLTHILLGTQFSTFRVKLTDNFTVTISFSVHLGKAVANSSRCFLVFFLHCVAFIPKSYLVPCLLKKKSDLVIKQAVCSFLLAVHETCNAS